MCWRFFPHGSDSGKAGKNGGGPYRSQPFRDPSGTGYSEEQGFSVKGRKCMVIGNGAMGKLTASTLLSEGADVTVTVRQYRSGIVDIP